jgi:hypothetical protein
MSGNIFGYEAFVGYSEAKGATPRESALLAVSTLPQRRSIVRVYDSNGRIVWHGPHRRFVCRERDRQARGLPKDARSYHNFDRQWRLVSEYAFHAGDCEAVRFAQRGPCTCGLGAKGGAR